MPFAHIDLSEQFGHLMVLLISLLHPVLLAALCFGFVLATAHLLVMFGTRWGDRRVTTKAFMFSLGLHLSMACGIVALIPEYRQRVLRLAIKEERMPIQIRTSASSGETGFDAHPGAGRGAGGSAAPWDRIRAHRLALASLEFH